ncbi:MAG TPA: acyl-CoA dehydrogenase family protein [Streptosporangiaceae bacterium]
MDFELDESQLVIAESVAAVLADAGQADGAGAARGSDPEWAPAWRGLARAGLLSLVLPGWMDGDDLGVLDAAVLLTETGRRAASLPALATIMLGALPVVRWGSRELQERVLAGVGSGEVILAAGVREQSAGWPAEPSTVATLDGDTGTVTGTKVGVLFAGAARWLLIPASLAGGGRAVVVIAASGDGVSMVATPVSGGMPEYTVRLDAAPVVGVLGAGSPDGRLASIGDQRAAAVDDLNQLAAAGAAALGDGALAGALALTAGYVASREQFGRPLATFQAVAGEAADIYIASRTLHLAALSACWRLSAGLDSSQDTAVAAYWLAQEAPAAMRTCHQLHGGIGLDISYPLHRYSSMVADLARFVGGAEYRLGLLADQVPVAG